MKNSIEGRGAEEEGAVAPRRHRKKSVSQQAGKSRGFANSNVPVLETRKRSLGSHFAVGSADALLGRRRPYSRGRPNPADNSIARNESLQVQEAACYLAATWHKTD